MERDGCVGRAELLGRCAGVAPLFLWARVRPSLSWATLLWRDPVQVQMRWRPFLTLPRPAAMTVSLGGCLSVGLVSFPCLALVGLSGLVWELAWGSVLAPNRGGNLREHSMAAVPLARPICPCPSFPGVGCAGGLVGWGAG